MAQNKKQLKSTYPLPAYNYRVTIQSTDDSVVLGFAEVSGLNAEYEPVTYKHGLSFQKGEMIIPGMRQPIRLTMKRGVVQNSNYLQEWINSVYQKSPATDAKREILIDLCDEVGEAVVRWKVQKALPIKLDAPTFDANSNDVAIESLELTAHDIQIDYTL